MTKNPILGRSNVFQYLAKPTPACEFAGKFLVYHILACLFPHIISFSNVQGL